MEETRFRDAPWHLRKANAGNYNDFRRVSRVHELTLGWLSELQVERKPYAMERGVSAELLGELPLLNALESTRALELESVLDDTFPEDVVGRLDHAIWSAHAVTWLALKEKTPESGLPALLATLEQTAWRLGRKSAEAIWPAGTLRAVGEDGLPDLRILALAAVDAPLIGKDGVLMERAIPHELRMALLQCPHHSPYPEVREQADGICQLQFHWLQGFAYGLNPRAVITREATRDGRCRLRWTVLVNPTA